MIDASIMAVVLFMINRPFYNGLINYTLFQIKSKEKNICDNTIKQIARRIERAQQV